MSDKVFHDAFKEEAYYLPVPSDVRCHNCGTKLKTYYAEARLYAVKCGYCETITLVKADNPTQAARYVGNYARTAYEQENIT
jgi:LSD1 subclass zinc finger protein